MEIIKLNLIPSGVSPTCYCSQYDNGRVIRVDLFDGLTPYVLQSGDVVTLNVRKPDNTIIVATLSATQGNTYVNIETTEQMCAVVGFNLCDLTITNGSKVIGTLNFIMSVERDVLADGIPSESVIEDLEALVTEAVGDQYYTKTETDEALALKADKSTTYTKTEVDNEIDNVYLALATKANASDVYNKAQIDNKLDLKANYSDVYTKSQVNNFLDEKADKQDLSIQNYCINEGKVIDKLTSLDNVTTAKYPNTAETIVSLDLTSQEAIYDKSWQTSIKRSTGAVAFTLTKTFAAIDFSEKDFISLWVYLRDLSKDDTIQVYFISGVNDTNHKAYKSFYTNDLYYGWSLLTALKEDFTLGSLFNWNNITGFQIRIVANAKTVNNKDYFELRINDLRIGKKFLPKIIFRFDDALKGVYANALPVLYNNGLAGITYASGKFNELADDPANIDPTASQRAGYDVPFQTVYCTRAELTELYNKGFDVGSHSFSHFVFTDPNAHYYYSDTDTDEQKRTSVLYQIKHNQDWLIDNGFYRSARHFAVPGGNDTEYCQQALTDAKVLTSTNSQHSNNAPCVNPFKIHAWGILNTDTPATVEGYIENAIKRGETCVLMFHDIVTTPNDFSDPIYQYLVSDFTEIVDYIIAQGYKDYVVTMSKWYEGLNREKGINKYFW